MKRVKKKYQTPVIHSIELGPISPVTASPGGGVTIPGGGNASGGGGGGGGGGQTPPPMQSPSRNLWESGFQTDDDDEMAYEYGW